MTTVHPYQRSFCVLFISLAVLFYFRQLKRNTTKEESSNQTENRNLTAASDIYPSTFENFENISAKNISSDIFNTWSILNVSFLDRSFAVAETESKNADSVIYILGLFELTSGMNRRPNGETELTAAKVAVKHVNALNAVPGYKLELVVNDTKTIQTCATRTRCCGRPTVLPLTGSTGLMCFSIPAYLWGSPCDTWTKCDPGVAIDRLFHAIYSEKRIVMLLGSGCSNVTEALAHIVPYWNIVQVSYGSKSPTLSDVKTFPFFFRTLAPDSSHDIAKIHFVKHYKWQVVATFSESENAYLLPVNQLITELEKENITCIATVTFSIDNYKEQLRVLKALDIRIIISSFSTKMAPRIFCEIFNLNMYGKEYVWILEKLQNHWWNTASVCSRKKITEAMEGVIMVEDYYSRYSRTFLKHINASFPNSALLAYDAIWAMALTLTNANVRSLDEFHYQHKDMACQFVSTMRNLEFIGLSGPIKFNGANRVGDLLVSQIQDGKSIHVALYDSLKNTLDFDCKFCHNLSWSDAHIPIAQHIFKEKLVTIPTTLFFAINGMSLVGILVSFIFLYLNLKFREKKTVKLSSPNLNNIAVAGCILVYLSIMVFEMHNVEIKWKLYISESCSLSSPNLNNIAVAGCILVYLSIMVFEMHNVEIKWKLYISESCSVHVYLLSAGFSLTFGSTFVKSYRVHRLFTYTSASLIRDKLLKDQHLIGLILIPLFIDTLIMSIWLAMDPLQTALHNLMLEISVEDPRVVYQPQVILCECDSSVGWFIALFGYKSLILVMGAYIAWKTRNVKVQVVNESQYIAICVYTCVFCTIIVTVFSFITDYFIMGYLVKSLSILASTTIILVLMFVPKFKSLFDDVDMELSIVESMGFKVQYNTRRLIADDSKELLHRLEIQYKINKARLQELDEELAYLEGVLNSKCNTSKQQTNQNVFAIKKYSFQESSASWPSWQGQMIKQFASENKLNQAKHMDKSNLFDRLMRFLGSITSLRYSHNNLDDKLKLEGNRAVENYVLPRSNPEIASQLSVPLNADPNKINSGGFVRKSY